MEYFILAKNRELAAIPADRKLFETYLNLGYRFLEKTSCCNEKLALAEAKRKYGQNRKYKIVAALLFVFVAYWLYFYTLLT
ncbi:hypothetical protein [Pseudoalteromonas sp. G4]|uniref:hypothetical protein n=1 Tax=Pseudoalteromonas sp. G4 TaxID=2992761 RepID=UPI00237E8A27|nr:hypothetical protein [Pseudoalteromonas sp. G4]MDE3271950.1 hypothetical protein [Pseudoalteromonas sp. G4]